MPQSATLQPRVMAHAEELFEVLGDPMLYEYLDEEPPKSANALREKLARSEGRKSPDGLEHWLNWTVRDEEGRAAGIVQTTIFPNYEANIAYVIRSAFGGKGLATNAVQQMLDLIVTGYEVTTFLITVDKRNERSIKLARRLGFTRATEEQTKSRTIAPSDLLFTRAARQ